MRYETHTECKSRAPLGALRICMSWGLAARMEAPPPSDRICCYQGDAEGKPLMTAKVKTTPSLGPSPRKLHHQSVLLLGSCQYDTYYSNYSNRRRSCLEGSGLSCLHYLSSLLFKSPPAQQHELEK
eukprot:1647417-Amphidinium_carterae.1